MAAQVASQRTTTAGSKADISHRTRHVRFTPESGHSRVRSVPQAKQV
jgi:hypothetical protein